MPISFRNTNIILFITDYSGYSAFKKSKKKVTPVRQSNHFDESYSHANNFRPNSIYDESNRDESPSAALFGPVKSEGFVSLRRDSDSHETDSECESDDNYDDKFDQDDKVLEEFKCLDWADDPLDNTGKI